MQLENKRIVFIGRLASMSRPAARAHLTSLKAIVRGRVSRVTDVVVLGADGWPKRELGGLTRNLQRAQEIQRKLNTKLEIISETELIQRIHQCQNDSVCRTLSIDRLSRILGISGLRLRRWIERGLVQAEQTPEGLVRCNFSQIAFARQLIKLTSQGIKAGYLLRTIQTLRAQMDHDPDLFQRILVIGKQICVRGAEGQVRDATGQIYLPLLINQQQGENKPIIAKPISVSFEQAFTREEAGDFWGAARYYLLWLRKHRDDVHAWFNLANVLRQRGQHQVAIRLYQHVLKLAPNLASGWNNLGLCYAERGDTRRGLMALRRAVAIAPEQIEAMFNLADLLDELGRISEARLMWLRVKRHADLHSEERAYAISRIMSYQ